MSSKLCMLFALVALSVVSVGGQTARPPTTQKVRFLTKPFDDAVDNVGPNFRGHDIEAIHDKLVSLGKKLKKNEFETVAEFERRIKLIDESPLFRFAYKIQQICLCNSSRLRVSNGTGLQ